MKLKTKVSELKVTGALLQEGVKHFLLTKQVSSIRRVFFTVLN